jgi:hypothetical protein
MAMLCSPGPHELSESCTCKTNPICYIPFEICHSSSMPGHRMQQMLKLILNTFCIFLLASTMSGCGLVVFYPDECIDETPTTSAHDLTWSREKPAVLTKTEFLKDWGRPDRIDVTSENMETWTYNRHLWCGIMPVFLLPVPLLLPVCDGFDRIEFQGDTAERMHIRRILSSGVVLPVVTSGDPKCRFPIIP